jgi:phosphatidylglycerophosphatase A
LEEVGGVFYRHVVNLMEKRGVSLEAIGEIVYELQRPYNDTLSLDECVESVSHVLKKREVQNALLTGIALDELAEAKKLPQPLQTMMEIDEPLYGVDEILTLSIINVYGSIGLTSFGYLDKIKVGILKRLNHCNDQIHVFLDDLVAGVAAAASARIAHRNPDTQRYAADMDESTGLDKEG